jgi:hypothetical protein
MIRLFGEWDIRPRDIGTHVVWWHGRHDANTPLSAVERFTARMSSVDLRVWDGGHLEAHRREEEVLADLLAPRG